MIQLKEVNKYFFKGESREVHALCDINLKIDAKDFMLLSGASGCGKTTLLNAIGALDSVDSGSIYFQDRDITTLSETQRGVFRLEEIGFVFQAYNLIPVLNVEENIGFVMKLRGFSDTLIKARVAELVEILEIGDKLHASVNTLSGGEQQRVAVARAVAPKPKIILADEPTANLDSKNSKRLMDMMRELNEKEGVCIVFASHDEYVLESVRRVVHMRDGSIVDDS